MSDVSKKCKDCGKTFKITEGQQKWFESKGFNLPVRCEDCRQKRKQQNLEDKKHE